MSFEYISEYYGVPAKKGCRIEFTGNLEISQMYGVIIGATNQYLLVKMDGQKRIWTLHPTWKIRYLTESENNQ